MRSYSTLLFYCSIALALCVGFLETFFVALGNDTRNLVQYGLRMLQEGGMYERWVEMNPPLVIVLYVLPAAFVKYVQLPAAMALHGLTALLCALSSYLVVRGLKATDLALPKQRMYAAASLFVIFLLPAMCMAYGDREHLLFIFALPWMVQMLLGIRPRTAYLLPAMAGFLIKPYNLIFFLILQLFTGPSDTSWKTKLFSAPVLVVTLACATYLACVYAVFPAYLSEVAPLARLVYPLIYNPPAYKFLILFTCVVPWLGLYILQYRRYGKISASFMVFLLVGACVFWLNGGWTYTLYLLLVPLIFLCCHTLVVFSEGVRTREKKEILIVSAAVIVITASLSISALYTDIKNTYYYGYPSNYHHLPEGLSEELREAAEQEFILFSTSLWGTNIAQLPGPPSHVFGFDYLWPLPWLMAHGQSPGADFVREMLRKKILLALDRTPLPVIIVDTSFKQRSLPDNVDILAFLRQDESVNQALKDYRMVRVIDYCTLPERGMLTSRCRFAVWKTGEKRLP